jgi:hypothetical protein
MTYITPSKWFASDDKELIELRKTIISAKNIVYLNHFNNASDIFGNKVDIKGGVSYFLVDVNYNDICTFNGIKTNLSEFDIIVEEKYYKLLNSIIKFSNKANVSSLYNSQGIYNVSSTDVRLKKTQETDMIKCYVAKAKGFVMFIDKKYISNDIDNYKIITTAAAHKGNSGFGNMFIGNKNEIHNKSYISFCVKNKSEADSLYSYLICKLPNLLLSLRKITHNLTNKNIFKWIPLPPLNKMWNDEEIYKYFKLSEEEIKLIKNTKISGYNDNKQTTKKKVESKSSGDLESEEEIKKKVVKKPVKKTTSKKKVESSSESSSDSEESEDEKPVKKSNKKKVETTSESEESEDEKPVKKVSKSPTKKKVTNKKN